MIGKSVEERKWIRQTENNNRPESKPGIIQ
jgi:hypothetical protein